VLRGTANIPVIRERTERVYDAFDELEDVLERELQKNAERDAV
jgi:ribosome-associated translation inhibitor RaiA